MSKAKAIAINILKTADKLGWNVDASPRILTISKQGINSTDAFVKADSEYYTILGMLPTTSPGSIWGTDGGGVGALSAMKSGVFVMKKSGGSIRVLNAILKLKYA